MFSWLANINWITLVSIIAIVVVVVVLLLSVLIAFLCAGRKHSPVRVHVYLDNEAIGAKFLAIPPNDSDSSIEQQGSM